MKLREQTDSDWNRLNRGGRQQKIRGKRWLDQVGPSRPRGNFRYAFLSKQRMEVN